VFCHDLSVRSPLIAKVKKPPSMTALSNLLLQSSLIADQGTASSSLPSGKFERGPRFFVELESSARLGWNTALNCDTAGASPAVFREG